MKLGPVLSASTIGVLIAAASAVPSLATEEETPPGRIVSVTPVAPTPSAEIEDEPTSTPSPTATESPSEDSSEEPVDDHDDDAEDEVAEEEDDPEDPSVIENLPEVTAEPEVQPSVQASEPPPVPAEAPTFSEALNSPFTDAESGASAVNNDSAAAETNNQAMPTFPQNSGAAPRQVANSPFANSPIAQAETNSPGNAPQGIVFGPQNLPFVPAEDVPFVGVDALSQALLDTQNPNDNAPVEETTAGTTEEPGRVESRRIVRPDQPTAPAPQENISNPQETPSNPEDSRPDATEDIRSAPRDNLVTTGAASTLLAIGGVLMIAGGAGILFWHRRLTSK